MAAALALIVSVPLMLLVRSMTRTTSTGLVGGPPHGPAQAADRTLPVLPLDTPIAGPNLYCVVTFPDTTMTLHELPATAGLHGVTQMVELHVQLADDVLVLAGAPGWQTFGIWVRSGRFDDTPTRQTYRTQLEVAPRPA